MFSTWPYFNINLMKRNTVFPSHFWSYGEIRVYILHLHLSDSLLRYLSIPTNHFLFVSSLSTQCHARDIFVLFYITMVLELHHNGSYFQDYKTKIILVTEFHTKQTFKTSKFNFDTIFTPNLKLCPQGRWKGQKSSKMQVLNMGFLFGPNMKIVASGVGVLVKNIIYRYQLQGFRGHRNWFQYFDSHFDK